jgi:ABC-2 type transport system permease protein
MIQFLATLHKELLLLRRDRSALLVLFVMPAVLVLVLTLVQENALKTIGEGHTQILFVNNDDGEVGRKIEQSLSEAQGVSLVRTLDGTVPDKETAVAAVARGRFQLCLIVPRGMTETIKTRARASARRALSLQADEPSASTAPAAGQLLAYFDPTILGGFRSAVKHLMQLMILGIEVEQKIGALTELLPVKMKKHLETQLGPMADQVPVEDDTLQLTWDPLPLMALQEQNASRSDLILPANSVQQNVPAWSLFGVFFIVLPMAGSFIKERLCGVEQRLLSLPVSYWIVLSGKVCAYILICIAQFGLILCIGKWLLPLLGSSAFEIGNTPGAVALVALSAVLAAAGYGILLGTLINSYEQAAMFGPISIVVAAAIGGIMVPVYAMPSMMRTLSVVSPLAWGQNAFQILFVRGGGLKTVLPEVTALLCFGLACMGVAWWWFCRKVYRRT